MDAEFWHGVWERNSIGFHQDEVHPFLANQLASLISKDDKHVFVPLCGKSLDMVWLAERMTVTGCELSEIACKDFFEEKNLPANISMQGSFARYAFEDITLYQGDFFQLEATQIRTEHGKVDWVFDRAALIALPPQMQQQYVDHLMTFVEQGTRLFLVTLEFPAEEMSGPPFPVHQSDVHTLFKGFNIEEVAEHSLKGKQFARRVFDVSSLVERLYIITR